MTAIADRLIESANKTQRWVRDRPLAVDGGFALLILLVELVDLSQRNQTGASREPDFLALLFVLMGALTLVWRRRHPVAAFASLTAVMVIFYLRDYDSFMSVIGLAGFYAVAAHASNRRHAWILIGTSTAVLFGTAAFTVLDRVDGFAISSAASMLTSISVAVFVGVVARNHEQIFKQAEARADEAEADRAAAAERARNDERLRIARELHDVVAHGMSVISVQAAAAQEIAHRDPDRAVELMHTVETTGRESLNEMRRMLGVLRNRQAPGEDGSASRGPQPSLDDIEETIEHCRAAGLPTEFHIVGEPRPLSPGLELTIYRIVQEALTNVLKHAGEKAAATVELSYRYTTVLVRISDDGRGLVAKANGSSAGNGLLGMRERVELYEGQLRAGPKTGGGYEVTAILPIASTTRPRVLSADAATTGQPT